MVNVILNRPFDSELSHAEQASSLFVLQNSELPEPAESHRQKCWVNISAKTTLNSLTTQSAHSEVDLIRLAHATQKESGVWLNALPSECIGTLMSDRDFVLAVSLRLGLPVTERQICVCGSLVGSDGRHFLSCKLCTTGREVRHNAVNDLLDRALRSASIPNRREPRHMASATETRPDGMTLQPWGKCLMWDATVRDPFATS